MTEKTTPTGPQPFGEIDIECHDVEIEGCECLAVKAADLHRLLQITRNKVDWVEKAIENCGYDYDIDYTMETTEDDSDGDYMIGIQMAKELAVACNTQRGNETRQYLANYALVHELSQGLF